MEYVHSASKLRRDGVQPVPQLTARRLMAGDRADLHPPRLSGVSVTNPTGGGPTAIKAAVGTT